MCSVTSGWAFEVKELTKKVSELEQEKELARQSCEDQRNELKVYMHHLYSLCNCLDLNLPQVHKSQCDQRVSELSIEVC